MISVTLDRICSCLVAAYHWSTIGQDIGLLAPARSILKREGPVVGSNDPLTGLAWRCEAARRAGVVMRSIPAISSAESFQSVAAMFCSSCSGELAPAMTQETVGRINSQEMANVKGPDPVRGRTPATQRTSSDWAPPRIAQSWPSAIG
jgi:hypothetical protein